MSFDKLFTTLSHLPVAPIADQVVESVLSGTITMLSSATGSGKSLFVSSLLTEIYQVEGPVIVLVPRRFLAQNAAETICGIIGCEVGGLVGYAVGSREGDCSFWSSETKLLFATNGYAIASGLINRANLFVLDEVHERTMDLSIVRALIHRRLARGEQVKVLEMSATFDPESQAAYWGLVAQTKVFEVDGQTFPCELIHLPGGNAAQEAIRLMREKGRRGVLVFRPGVGEVEETATEIRKLVEAGEFPIDVFRIYGEMDYQERQLATAAPEDGKSKILVCTNVVESGVNLSWVDGGVTCGTGKERTVRTATGAARLELVDLSQWRLAQQEGRVKRFGPGIFVLCSKVGRNSRPIMTHSEIERLPLTELVLHCACLGLRTDELMFDSSLDPDKVRAAEEKLQTLGLIDDGCMPTEAGRFTSELPLGPETRAMLWHSIQFGCLPQMIALASVIEAGGLRRDLRLGHNLDRQSDLFDGLRALGKVHESEKSDRRKVMDSYNISFKRYRLACGIGRALERKLGTEADLDFAGVRPELRRCIFAGSLDRLYRGTRYADSVVSIAQPTQEYGIDRGACCRHVDESYLVAGELRTITPKDDFKWPFTILQNVTVGTLDDIKAIAEIRPEVLTEEVGVLHYLGRPDRDIVTYKLFGKYPIASHIREDDDPMDLGLDDIPGEDLGSSEDVDDALGVW